MRILGQYYDQETGLHYNWWRYYAPESGRYVSPDPMQFSMQGFIYAANRPARLVDPRGLYPWGAGTCPPGWTLGDGITPSLVGEQILEITVTDLKVNAGVPADAFKQP